jgi:hypothetical protein
MWLEIVVGGGMVTFSQVGAYLDSLGKDPRCEWASKIEAQARRFCGRSEGIVFSAEKGDLSIRLHEDAVPAVVRAITESEPSMPEAIRGFYQRVVFLLENGERVKLSDPSMS